MVRDSVVWVVDRVVSMAVAAKACCGLVNSGLGLGSLYGSLYLCWATCRVGVFR